MYFYLQCLHPFHIFTTCAANLAPVTTSSTREPVHKLVSFQFLSPRFCSLRCLSLLHISSTYATDLALILFRRCGLYELTTTFCCHSISLDQQELDRRLEEPRTSRRVIVVHLCSLLLLGCPAPLVFLHRDLLYSLPLVV